MAISTYSDLVTAVGNWINRGDLTARIPEFIALAEAQINRRLRVHRMEVRDQATISNEFSELPATFLEAKSFTLADGSDRWALEPAPSELLDQPPVQAGRPRFFAVVGEEVRFYPTPDKAYQGIFTYYERIPALTAAAPTNWLLSWAPDAYLYGALLQAGPYLKDADAAQVYSDGFQAALTALQAVQRAKVGRLRTDAALSERGYSITTDTL